MKLAIQISGDFRVLQFCGPSLQQFVLNAFPNTKVDTFIHTWWREDNLSSHYNHGIGLAFFQPRSYFLEKLENLPFLQQASRATAMFYSIMRANQARKEYETLMETKYDLVMRYRTDCIFNESLFDIIQPYLREKKPFLCIPKPLRIPMADGPVADDESTSLCDWFAIGTPDMIDVYCETFKTFQDFDVSMVPESMLALQLKAHGITRETTLRRPPMDLFLVDGSGQIRGAAAGKESLKSPDETEER